MKEVFISNMSMVKLTCKMEEKSVKRFIVLSCMIVVFLAALVYKFEYFTAFSFFKKKHFLIIGILSAPENFEQRLSIRKTWLQLISELSASAYFIIGNKNCEVPPYDRTDPYSCVDKPFVLPENATDLTEFTTMKVQNVDSKRPSYIGFGFYVRNTIIVKKLGILRELLLFFNKEIQVKLISAFDNKVLASVTFSSDLLNECNSSVLTKAIRPVQLNSNFEGILKLEMKDIAGFLPECNFALWENKPYVINFIELLEEGSVIPQPFDENSCTYVFMTYTVLDTDNIKLHTNNRTVRLKEWHNISINLSESLQNESKMYNDIFLVDVVDVYRNLSLKLTHFYKRILNTEYFQYVLKTDDDSFIDILRVYEHLKQVNGESSNKIITPTIPKFWLWSHFKQFWKVEHSGKWRENQYQSASYPTFPCGGGYILNKEVVNFISENKNLHHFQGEDVSLGIWLSTFPVTHYKTPKLNTKNSYQLQKKIITKFKGKQAWEDLKMNKTIYKMASNLCEWTCDNFKYFNMPLCNNVQLSTAKMYWVWENYIKNGFL